MDDITHLQSLEAQTPTQAFREVAAEVRNIQRGISTRQGVYNCGRARIHGSHHGVLERLTYGDATHTRIRGLQVCDSYFCSDCSVRMRKTAQGELERLLLASAARKYEVIYAVLTLDNSEWVETPRFHSRKQAFIASDEYRSLSTRVEQPQPEGTGFASKAEAEAAFYAAHPELPPNSWEAWGHTKKIADRTEAMSLLQRGGSWTRITKTFGILGLLHINEDTVEARESQDGYFNFGYTRLHTTKNVIIIRDPARATGSRDEFYAALVKRWVSVCASLGWKAAAPHQSLQWVKTTTPEALATVAHYVTKQLSLFTTPSNRTVREDGTTSFTPWGVLQHVAETTAAGRQNRSAVEFWQTYENAYKGRPFITKTPQLLKRLGIPEDEVKRPPRKPSKVELVDVLSFDTLSVVTGNPTVHTQLLNAVENDPTNEAARSLLTEVERQTARFAA